MNRPAVVGAGELIGPLLRSVSRSFYVSIRILPADLRQPVGVAYLLARATDTIADTVSIDVARRKPALETLSSSIQAGGIPGAVDELCKSFAPLQKDPAERRLIESLPQCLEALGRLEPLDQKDVRVCLEKINTAQRMDVQLFGSPEGVTALSTERELDNYTYLIAGCVGEFWTRLCARHLRNFSELPETEMEDLGRRYGEGLQLINILRDAGGDLRAGRCYLPNEELEQEGVIPNQILQKPASVMPIFRKWLDRAEDGLKAGIKYSLAVRNRRVRAATAVPALIGARTIALLRAAGDAVLEEKIKVPRDEVRRLLRKVAVSLASKRTLEKLFRCSPGR